MSTWQSYIDNLVQSGCQYAAIAGYDGSIWAANFNIHTEEIKALVRLGTRGGDVSEGLRVGSWEYTVVSLEVYDNIRLKRKNCNPEEKFFVYCGVTKTAIIIGAVPSGANERNCCVVVASMQEHLVNSDL